MAMVPERSAAPVLRAVLLGSRVTVRHGAHMGVVTHQCLAAQALVESSTGCMVHLGLLLNRPSGCRRAGHTQEIVSQPAKYSASQSSRAPSVRDCI
jgi:hypothetical protein